MRLILVFMRIPPDPSALTATAPPACLGSPSSGTAGWVWLMGGRVGAWGREGAEGGDCSQTPAAGWWKVGCVSQNRAPGVFLHPTPSPPPSNCPLLTPGPQGGSRVTSLGDRSFLFLCTLANSPLITVFPNPQVEGAGDFLLAAGCHGNTKQTGSMFVAHEPTEECGQ